MAGIALRVLLAGVLATSAIAKLASPAARDGLETFGIRAGRLRLVVWGALIATELAIAAGVAAGLDAFAIAGALLMLAFSGALVTALARGRGGSPCACFGARSNVSRAAVARNFLLAAGLAAVPFFPADGPSTEGWLAI